MHPDVVRYLLIAFAIYMVLKTATAKRRGSFLTVFGNIRPGENPAGFMACLIGGYALALILLVAAISTAAWLPRFS